MLPRSAWLPVLRSALFSGKLGWFGSRQRKHFASFPVPCFQSSARRRLIQARLKFIPPRSRSFIFGRKFLRKAAGLREFFISSDGSPRFVLLSYPVVESDASSQSLGFHFLLPGPHIFPGSVLRPSRFFLLILEPPFVLRQSRACTRSIEVFFA